MTRYDYTIHPFALLFPELPAKEYQELKADIQKNGQLEKIVISRQHVLLDGRNRMKVCEQLGITPRTIFFDDVPNIGGISETDFIWAKNAVRRHLTDDQRAILAAQWAEEIEKDARQRQTAGLKKGVERPVVVNPPPREKTRNAVARRAKVSTHKARQALVVVHDAPQLAPKVASGETKLKDAVKQVNATEARRPPTPTIGNMSVEEYLRLTAMAFDARKFGEEDPAAVRSLLKPGTLQILDAFHLWLEKILAA